MPPLPFRIGINMAGAISAGAYTAGVFDFLIEALDAWQKAKEDGEAVPRHEISIQVLSGASAGGMCAAIAAVALFDKKPRNGPSKFYSAWVDSIDIKPLLHQGDLRGSAALKSLLNSEVIGRIAKQALHPTEPSGRTYVSKELNLILTLTDVRGIPYGVNLSNDGSFEERTNYYADQIQFQVTEDERAAAGTNAVLLPLHDLSSPAWETLRTAAVGTGAVPVMLAPQILERCAKDYESRLWQVSNATPCKDPGDGTDPSSESCKCWCEQSTRIMPAWETPTSPFQKVYIDGGTTNNNPFECARLFLARQRGALHNLRPPELADAAVITIAPFPGADDFDPAWNEDKEEATLKTVLGSLKNILVNQSRFTGESLSLLNDLSVASRYMISPDDSPDKEDDPGKADSGHAAPAPTAGSAQKQKAPALQCGSLAAFGGFLSRDFRDRDYQLGRRNCQMFLRKWFVLPTTNHIIAEGISRDPAGLIKAFQAARVEQRDEEDHNQHRPLRDWMPIIPLVGRMQDTIPNPGRKTMPVRSLDKILGLAAARLARILRKKAPPGAPGFVLSLFAGVIAGHVVRHLRPALLKDLKRAKCLPDDAS